MEIARCAFGRRANCTDGAGDERTSEINLAAALGFPAGIIVSPETAGAIMMEDAGRTTMVGANVSLTALALSNQLRTDDAPVTS